jgi:hypothetical protein
VLKVSVFYVTINKALSLQARRGVAMHSDQENAKLLLRLIYGHAPLENPYKLSVETIVQTFHQQEGARLPSSMRPMDLDDASRFIGAVETAAKVVSIGELARLADMFPTDSALENHLRMLRDQAELPVISASYLALNMVSQLRDELRKYKAETS